MSKYSISFRRDSKSRVGLMMDLDQLPIVAWNALASIQGINNIQEVNVDEEQQSVTFSYETEHEGIHFHDFSMHGIEIIS